MTWHSRFQLDTNALAKLCPHREFLCARHHCHHHIQVKCVRRGVCICPLSLRFPFALFPLVCCLCASVWWCFCPRSKKMYQVTAHSRVVKQNLCSNKCSNNRSKFPVVLQGNSIWKTMASWRASAVQYASAIQLWGRAAKLCEMDPWPPSRGLLDAYAFFFQHGPSRYLSHIRSALRLLEAPVNVLAETARMIRGAMKLSVGSVRFKPQADAEQTRALVNCARKDFGRSDITDSWIVARHFCLRYGAEVVPMQTAGNHSAVHVAEEKDALPVVTLTLFRRKMHNSPVTVVRRCICKLQGRTLCGACVLKTRVGDIRWFPHMWCTEGLAYLKAAAMHLRLGRASEWGTHAFSAWLGQRGAESWRRNSVVLLRRLAQSCRLLIRGGEGAKCRRGG